MEKWFVINKGADFEKLGKEFGISPVTARLIRNREVIGEAAFERYLNGSLKDLYDPHLLKDADRLTDILKVKIEEQKPVRIIGDYDIDGVMSTYILYRGIQHCGGNVSTQIPDRMKDGYGINENLIDQAKRDGMDTILTCDNGIAAISEIAHAKELGMTVLVTDHHEIPYIEENGEKQFLSSNADAIVNPKQRECAYPFKELCGAAVAWKVLQVLYEKMGFALEETYEFLENVAFATVGDVMDLQGENRIFVKAGLRALHKTQNLGLQELIRVQGIEAENVTPYHIGFVLGPCINASGRLDTAEHSLKLLCAKTREEAAKLAGDLKDLNESRKELTRQGEAKAIELVETSPLQNDKVLVVYLPDCHESLAGIIAGRLREHFHKPSFVLTRSEEGVKGSGRSIEAYSMYEELCKCKELMTKFGGHPMAAGLSLAGEEMIEPFRRALNDKSTLTEEDFVEKVVIDVPMPITYITKNLIRQLSLLEPFGKGNTKPLFAQKGLTVLNYRIFGKNRNVVKVQLADAGGYQMDGVYFGEGEAFAAYVDAHPTLSVAYYPSIDTWNGRDKLQINIQSYF